MSLCENNLVEELGVKGTTRTLTISEVNKNNVTREDKEVKLNVKSLDGLEEISLENVYTVEKLPVSPNSIARKDDTAQWPHLADICFS